MKKLLTFTLLVPMIVSCAVYETVKTERTMTDIEDKETTLQSDLDKTQKDINRVEKEIETEKKGTAK